MLKFISSLVALSFSFHLNAESVVISSSKKITAGQYKKSSFHQVWQLKDGLKNPESVVYDEQNKCFYVSNVNGGPTDKDSNGFITKVDMNGALTDAAWVSGLHAPKGMRIYKGSLWVSDIDRVLRIDIKNPKAQTVYNVVGAKFLNDIAVAPDGRVYVSDMLGQRIYRIGKDDQVDIFDEGSHLEMPNGLWFKGNQLFVAGWGTAMKEDFSTESFGSMYSVNVQNKVKKSLVSRFGNLDGLEFAGDALGDGYLVSDWMAGKVYLTNGSPVPTLMLSGLEGSADIAYIESKNILLVPEMKSSRLTAYALRQNIEPKIKVSVALDWTPNTNHTGMYVAKDLNFSDSFGIELSFLQQAQTNATQLVAQKKVQVGVSFVSDLIKARAKGLPVKAIAAIIQTNTACFAWRKSSGIQTVKDWEGKRYGGWGSPEETESLKYIMEKSGADFSKLKIVTTGVSDFMPTTEKNADFMWIYLGWGGIEAKLAGVDIGTICPSDIDPMFDRPSPLLIANENELKKSPDLYRNFLRAVSGGYMIAIEEPQRGAASLLKYVPELKPQLVKDSADYLGPLYSQNSKSWGTIKPDVWSLAGKWMLDRKLVSKIEPAESYFTNEYLP